MQSNASFWESARVAADSLRSSKLRSFLTLLGIILSTTTLIAVMSVIHGMDVYIADTVSSMGSDGFQVVRMAFVGNFDPKKFLEMQRKNPQLSRDEFQFLKSKVTLMREIGISSTRGGKVAHSGDSIDGVQIIGGSPNAGVITNTQVALGRFPSEPDNNRKATVVVLGADIKERFFPATDPIGKTIDVDGRPFEVVGVAKSKGSIFGQSQDNFIYIPIETFFKIYGTYRGIMFGGLARDRSVLMQAQDEVRMLLRAYRHIRPGDDDTFSILSSDTLVSAFDQLTSAVAATAVAIVSVFMVVGGVVIMNIMLAVVSERTREIGVRKALGARRQDILSQFLVESSMLSASGGLIGVALAWGVAVAVRNLTAVPMTVPASSVLIAVGLSTVVGLFFGIYPARQASKLDPIVALRAES
ncbi:MAG: ABC transporter permease [Bryobacteraceae bacterium]